jgi:hypothetical protein
MTALINSKSWSFYLLLVAGGLIILLYYLFVYLNVCDPIDSSQLSISEDTSIQLSRSDYVSIFHAGLFSQPPSKAPYKLNDPKKSNYAQFKQDIIMNEVSGSTFQNYLLMLISSSKYNITNSLHCVFRVI